ncbi:hypothetical protein KDL44_03240 [bacterium]|nr:hypothetical protein [bacterium]
MWIRFATGLSLLLALLASACAGTMQQFGNGSRDLAASLSLHVLDESFIADSTAESLELSSRQLGNELLVSVRAGRAQNLRALYYEVEFDAARLNPLSASPAAAFGNGEEVLSMMQPTAPGRVQAGQVLVHPEEQAGFSGEGELALLRFRIEPQARIAAKVNDSAKATPLQLSWDNDAKLARWLYNNPADYDQNGEVNVADLTPLAQHFNKSQAGGFPLEKVESVVDGDGNGVINLADITPIGINFGNAGSGGYHVFEIVGGNHTDIDSLALATASGDKSKDRLGFSYAPGNPLPGNGYYPRLEDGSGNLGFTPAAVFVPEIVDEPPFIVLDFLDRPAQGSGTDADPFILTDTIIGNNFTFRITDDGQNVTGQAGVEIRASAAGATLSIDQPTGEVQFDPAYQNTQFSLDGVADSVDTQNSLHFLYVPEVVELLYIMPDPADADWAGLEGDGSEANPWLVRNVAFNSDGQTMFSFVANTLPDGSGDVVDVNSLTWAAVPSQNVFNNWEPPGTAQFHPNVTDCYVFATNGDGVESNRIYCRAKPFPTL